MKIQLNFEAWVDGNDDLEVIIKGKPDDVDFVIKIIREALKGSWGEL